MILVRTFILILILIPTLGKSQQLLLMGHPGKHRTIFKPGDEITLLTNQDETISGRITYLVSNKIGIGDRVVVTDSVKMVIFPNHYIRLRQNGVNVILSTLSLLTIDVLNRKINNNEKAFDAQNLGVSSVLISIGLIMMPFKDKKKKINKRRPLKILDLG